MRPTEKLRAITFWTYDYLKGGRIRKNFLEIQDMLANPDDSNVINLHDRYLNRILGHAVSNTQFYSHFANFKSINDFPVINKIIIRENIKSFISKGLDPESLHKVTTSGSTGAPFTVYQDKMKRMRHQAENIYFSENAGYSLGSRLYYMRVWNSINKKSFFKRTAQNIIMEDASNLSDKAFEQLIYRLKKDKSTKSLLAFSSTYEALSQFLMKRDLSVNVKTECLITMSETLPEGARTILRKAFNCPVVSRYSNMENGFLAQQCKEDNNEYHINTASFHIELLNELSDRQVQPGERGRIVVTDLFNFAMPLIRYDTGDIGVSSLKSACGQKGSVFSTVEGRKVDFIRDTAGNLLSPHVITNTMWKYADKVIQFQFIQNSAVQYQLHLNCKVVNNQRDNEIISDFRTYLGNNAEILIDYVDEIPLLASGKRKKIVNNYR